MKYLYDENGFEFGHWLLQIIGNFVTLAAIICRILTLNLVWFDFELQYTMWSISNADRITKWFNNKFKFKK